MQIAVLTLNGFNEVDSFVASTILNRLSPLGWKAYITAPDPEIVSMNGVRVVRQKPIEFAGEADAVLIGSGIKTRDYAADSTFLSRIVLDPRRQLIGAQCSGTLLLAKLGLLGDLPACTDLISKPWVVEAGVTIVDAPFVAHGNVATAGGCLASQYLACWLIARLASLSVAEEIIRYFAPVGEKEIYARRAMDIVTPYCLPSPADAQAIYSKCL